MADQGWTHMDLSRKTRETWPTFFMGVPDVPPGDADFCYVSTALLDQQALADLFGLIADWRTRDIVRDDVWRFNEHEAPSS